MHSPVLACVRRAAYYKILETQPYVPRRATATIIVPIVPYQANNFRKVHHRETQQHVTFLLGARSAIYYGTARRWNRLIVWGRMVRAHYKVLIRARLGFVATIKASATTHNNLEISLLPTNSLCSL